jgi:hypothetical protein
MILSRVREQVPLVEGDTILTPHLASLVSGPPRLAFPPPT